ncbi:hypothetical protein [uncultured Brevundimonas sp.]|jgi:hypothetical protein|uniref:hypothetical protein n=1 Tax=uncultured Brevundimonas sp. TaxID=213418 RepID=UPI002632AACA|nr:hypothetical protein [uncultured Brevundimonas sp.]
MTKLQNALMPAAMGAFALIASAPAQAQTGDWYGTVSAPVIRQTNTTYTSGNIWPGATPSGAVVTSTAWYATYPSAPGGTSFQIRHCRTATSTCSPYSGFNSGTSTFHSGAGALQQFYFNVRINASSTYTLGGSYVSTPLQLTVYYSY